MEDGDGRTFIMASLEGSEIPVSFLGNLECKLGSIRIEREGSLARTWVVVLKGIQEVLTAFETAIERE